jgi:hypothetical protein
MNKTSQRMRAAVLPVCAEMFFALQAARPVRKSPRVKRQTALVKDRSLKHGLHRTTSEPLR